MDHTSFSPGRKLLSQEKKHTHMNRKLERKEGQNTLSEDHVLQIPLSAVISEHLLRACKVPLNYLSIPSALHRADMQSIFWQDWANNLTFNREQIAGSLCLFHPQDSESVAEVAVVEMSGFEVDISTLVCFLWPRNSFTDPFRTIPKTESSSFIAFKRWQDVIFP